MKIGLVLSSTPSYSETFFNSKIKGLLDSGFRVVLYVQHKNANFDLCPVFKAPKIYKNTILQLFSFFFVCTKLTFHFNAVKKFIILERQQSTSGSDILKKIYLNAHILSQQLDWLHFGFATQAIGKELVAKAINAKMAVSLRGFDICIYPIKHPNCYNLLWKHVDRIHTISNDLLDKAYCLGLSDQVIVKKISPAIDIKLFNNKAKKRIRAKEKIQFLTVARLHWKKGIILALKALSLLMKKNIEFTYTIVGDGIEYERIVFEIHRLGLTNFVNLVGEINREEIVKIYSQSDIYLQYSISEGFCNAVLEAQAMGLLCIVSDAEGLSENVLHKETGWVVSKGDPKKLCEQIIYVSKLSITDKNKIITRAEQRVKKEFNIKKQQQEFLKFYQNF